MRTWLYEYSSILRAILTIFTEVYFYLLFFYCYSFFLTDYTCCVIHHNLKEYKEEQKLFGLLKQKLSET